MATVVNFIDVTLRGAAARTVNLASAQILLTASAPAFHVDANGVLTPETITFTATLIDLDAPLAFNATGAPLTNPTAKSVTVAGAAMTGSSVTVIASATVNGATYTGPCTISKVTDGRNADPSDPADLSPEALKAILEGQLTEDQLYQGLQTRIDLIDAPADTAGSVTARVKAETDARIAAISQQAQDNRTYVQQYTYSQQTINDSFSAFGTNIQASYQGYADNAANGALAAAKAFAQSYSYSTAQSDSALTATANQLRAEFQSLNQGAGATVAWVQEYTYSKAQANDAIAESTRQLRTTVGEHSSTLEIQGQSISGLGAQYTVKIDNNGYTAGYGLASTPINGVPTSSFIVLADRFAVALPGQTPKFPFVIGTVNGQTVIGLRGDVVLDGTLNIRATDGLAPALATAATTSTWDGVSNRPISCRAVSRGFSGIGNNIAEGFYVEGVLTRGAGSGYTVVAIRRSDRAIVYSNSFFPLVDANQAAQMANVLNNINSAHIVVVFTADEPQTNRLSGGLAASMYRCGASRAVFGSSQFMFRSAYILVGIPGCGEGNGSEAYQGSVSDDHGAWCDMGITIDDLGNYQTSNNYTPKTLQDYGYTGDMNASWGAPAGTNVGNAEAQQVTNWAYNGQQALNALPNKIDAVASSILRAPITITTGGGVVVGSLTYDASSGLRGSGSGVAITPYGLITHNGSKYTFALNGADGNCFFGGELQAPYGTFGALRIASGGYIAQNFGGSWNWADKGAGAGFLIHPNGMLFGDANNANMSFVQINAAGEMLMPGFTYTGRQLRLDSPLIVNPVLSPFNLGITNSQNQYSYTLYRGSTDAYAGLYTVAVSTGNDGASFNWTVSGPWPCWLVQDSSSSRMQLHINMKGGAALAGDAGDFYINCSATKGGNTVNTQQLVTVTAS